MYTWQANEIMRTRKHDVGAVSKKTWTGPGSFFFRSSDRQKTTNSVRPHFFCVRPQQHFFIQNQKKKKIFNICVPTNFQFTVFN